jgi:hypothetical protein
MLGCIGFRFCLVQGPWQVLWRRVDRDESEPTRPDAHDVMSGTGANEKKIVRMEQARLGVESRLTFAIDDEKELIDVWVNFFTDLAAWRYCHDDNLLELSRYQLPSKCIIRLGRLDDVELAWLLALHHDLLLRHVLLAG